MTGSSEPTLQPRMTKKPPFSVEVPNSKPVPGQTIPRRHPAAREKFVLRPSDDVSTIYDILRRGARVHGDNHAVGSRRLIRTHVDNKKVKKVVDGVEQLVDKKWTFYELSPYTFKSFREYEKLALELGAGLRKLGLEKDDKIHLYGATSANWLAMAHGMIASYCTFSTVADFPSRLRFPIHGHRDGL